MEGKMDQKNFGPGFMMHQVTVFLRVLRVCFVFLLVFRVCFVFRVGNMLKLL